MRERLPEIPLPRFAVILACAAGAALTACSDTLASSAQRLAGSWTWVHTYGGIIGHVITPASAGYTERLRFTEDMWWFGTVESYRDDTLIVRRRYQLRLRDFGHGERLVIQYEGHGDQFVKFAGDTLMLLDRCDDCYQYTYIRSP
jgi:hypothetical protein